MIYVSARRLFALCANLRSDQARSQSAHTPPPGILRYPSPCKLQSTTFTAMPQQALQSRQSFIWRMICTLLHLLSLFPARTNDSNRIPIVHSKNHLSSELDARLGTHRRAPVTTMAHHTHDSDSLRPAGNTYQNVLISGNARVHLGNSYQIGESGCPQGGCAPS